MPEDGPTMGLISRLYVTDAAPLRQFWEELKKNLDGVNFQAVRLELATFAAKNKEKLPGSASATGED